MSETQLVKSILEVLAWKYKGRGKFWRNNTGATKTATGGFVRYGAVGSPDILGVLSPSGRLVCLEVKTTKGKTSPAQEAWLEETKALGAVAAVVRSIDDALATLESVEGAKTNEG
jgi:hypothetical protein